MSFMVLTQSKPLEVADSTVSPNVHCVLKNSDFSQYDIHLPEMRGFDFLCHLWVYEHVTGAHLSQHPFGACRLPWVPSILRPGLLVHCYISKASWSVSFCRFSCLCLTSPSRSELASQSLKYCVWLEIFFSEIFIHEYCIYIISIPSYLPPTPPVYASPIPLLI